MQMAATTKFPEADSSPTLPGRMLNLRRDESESGICGDSNLEEFTILQENYAVLCNTMTDIDDLLKYFVAEKIITLNEEEEIKSSATKSDKVRKLLLNISGPLKAGNNNGFYTMLKIMKDRGTKATQNLATFLSSRITTKDVPLHEHFESVDDIQKTSDYLRNRYTQNRYIPSTDDNWLPYHPKHYTPLTFVHHEGRRTQSEMDEIAAMMVSTEIGSDGGSKGLKKVVDLCLHFDVEKASPYKILIEGAPGIGKTVLSKEIALQWAEHNILKQRCMLFLLFIRDQEVKKISDLQSLVKYFCQDDSTCTKVTKWLKETNGRYLTIVVDGYDEASKDDNIIHLINNGIIGRTVLTECGLVITSRPAASSHLHDITDCRVEVLGFAEEDRIKFINDALKDEHKIKELEKFLTSTPFINTLCYIPLYMSILLCLIEGGVRTLPKTQTNLLKKFIVMTIVHFLNKTKGESITEITSLDELPATYNQAVKELSHFAFIALQEDKLVFTKAEVNKACPNLTPSNNWYILGLLIPVQYFKPQDSCHHNISFHFLHLSIQEYLAAYHITYLSSDKRLTLLQDTFLDVHYANVWVMYFGIKGSNDGAFKQFICDSRFQSTVINWFQTIKNKQKAINIKSTILNDKIKCLHLLHCLTESEDCEVLSSVVSIFRGKCFDLSNQSLSYNDMYTLAVVLKKLQPNEQWDKLDLSRCNIDGKSSHSGISAEAADDIAAILSNNTKLQELYLNGNNLQTKGVRFS
ncbi:NACHT, LRR and PYD domains-containing protein 14-like [Dysidea avara]|uniref:NACHT, LRR and PYD domains-containing protein 14-like n=1 Tax=Dysidea avara TaxID=196820 RepID=UPI00332094D1